MANKDASQLIADVIAGIEYDDLPADVVEITRKDILDTIGVIVAASGLAPEPRAAIRLMMESGGRKESSIIGHGNRVPCHAAAFANGAMCHSLDYDDLAHPIGHIAITTIPAALAVCQRIGKVNGKQLITAVALGNEVLLRLGRAVRNSAAMTQWFVTPVNGVFSASAAVGKLLGLSSAQLANAFGIALCQASGCKEMGVGGIVRAMYGAFPARTGVVSALLAADGVTGPERSLEGDSGLFQVYFRGQYDRASLVEGVGKDFVSPRLIGFKPWCACGHTHAYIDSVLGLVKQHGIALQRIDRVTAHVDDYLRRMLCEPAIEKRQPQASIVAKFSIPFTIAIALASGWVRLADFTPEAIRDSEVLKLAQKVVIEVDSDIGRVDIRTNDGKVYSSQTEYPLGFPQKPLTTEQIEAKFTECMQYSARPLKPQAAAEVLGLIRRLDEVKDVSRIVKLVAPRVTSQGND